MRGNNSVSKDEKIGKNGLGIFFLGLCPLVFFGVTVALYLGMEKFDGQDGGAVALLYGVLSMACLLYALYMVYCLSFAVKTARIVEYSNNKLSITDCLGRTFIYAIESVVSCEPTRLNFLLNRFFLFRVDKINDAEKSNRVVRFQDGRSFILTSRIQGIEERIL